MTSTKQSSAGWLDHKELGFLDAEEQSEDSIDVGGG
jgi:hypothetical protein